MEIIIQSISWCLVLYIDLSINYNNLDLIKTMKDNIQNQYSILFQKWDTVKYKWEIFKVVFHNIQSKKITINKNWLTLEVEQQEIQRA